jgi:hypothetical protein
MPSLSHPQTVVRLCAGLAILGLTLALLQPPLPRAGGAACPQLPFALCPRLWDQRHVPMHEADDAAIWASGLGRREHWTRWLLVAAVGVGLVGASGAAPGGRAPAVRLLLGAGGGALVGYYLALEAVPGQEVLQVRRRGRAAAEGAVVQSPGPGLRRSRQPHSSPNAHRLLNNPLPPPARPADARAGHHHCRGVLHHAAAEPHAGLRHVAAAHGRRLARRVRVHAVRAEHGPAAGHRAVRAPRRDCAGRACGLRVAAPPPPHTSGLAAAREPRAALPPTLPPPSLLPGSAASSRTLC